MNCIQQAQNCLVTSKNSHQQQAATTECHRRKACSLGYLQCVSPFTAFLFSYIPFFALFVAGTIHFSGLASTDNLLDMLDGISHRPHNIVYAEY
jgi:hypothetical protein